MSEKVHIQEGNSPEHKLKIKSSILVKRSKYLLLGNWLQSSHFLKKALQLTSLSICFYKYKEIK